MSWIWYLIPHHLISRLIYWLTRLHAPFFPVTTIIRVFIRLFRVDMEEAAEANPKVYPTFNAFFTRPLRIGAREISHKERDVICPADGRISQLGTINEGQILQAKGQEYSVFELLGGSQVRATPFNNGNFCTVYLSPRDYHRVHMPTDAKLIEMVHIPGRLFSVAPSSVKYIPRLFSRNERMAAVFETPHGPMALILVGALNVAAIETVWAGLITPPAGKHIETWDYTKDGNEIRLHCGEEMGRFNMGSTVIMLFPKNVVEWKSQLTEEMSVKMGHCLGRFLD
jgi:phosphatidylserine decarboxylase